MQSLLKTQLNPLVINYIQKITKFCDFWEFSKDLKKDFYSSLKKTVIITSAGASTRIEGARLTDKEIEDRLENLKIQKFKDRDEAEVVGYIDCMNYIFDNFKDLTISEYTIRSLHSLMCTYLSNDIVPPDQRGAYKNITNTVVRIDHSTGLQEIIFQTTPPGPQTDVQMKQLIDDYNNYIKDPHYNSLIVIAAFIVKFLAIHPFRDGNGRISRLLTNVCLLRQGYEFCMYSSHEKVIEDNKDNYYVSLRQTQSTFTTSFDLNPWLIFFLKTLEIQTDQLKNKLIPKKKLGTTTKYEAKIIELIQEHQPVTIGFLERTLNIKRVTLKTILRRLKAAGIIEMEGEKKGSSYKISGVVYVQI